METKCPFCGDEIKERVIDQGDLSLVVISNPRMVYGHLLVMPKRHVYRYSDLTKEEVNEFFTFLSKYQDKILEKLSKGTEVRQSYAPFRENNKTHVNHFHFNIFPRDEDDEMSEKVDSHRRLLYQDVSDEEIQTITKLLVD